MFKVGLTGGIASGKTSVANWFAAKGIPVINADETAHQLMEQSSVVSAVGQELGSEYIENGKINRTLLGNRVFSDPMAKKRLEKIIHPLVAKVMKKKSTILEKEGYKVIILDVPLLFEVGWDKSIDEVWVVFVSPDIQKKRLMSRNGFNEKEAEKRIGSQMPLEEKIKRAHRIINNSGTWEETEKYLQTIWLEIK